jgi:hypothetical protein
MAQGKFPGPYTNSVKQDDAIMHYVPFDRTSIGSRPSGLPKGNDVESSSMDISHVENRKTGG